MSHLTTCVLKHHRTTEAPIPLGQGMSIELLGGILRQQIAMHFLVCLQSAQVMQTVIFVGDCQFVVQVDPVANDDGFVDCLR